MLELRWKVMKVWTKREGMEQIRGTVWKYYCRKIKYNWLQIIVASKEDTEVVNLGDWADAGVMTGNKDNMKQKSFR